MKATKTPLGPEQIFALVEQPGSALSIERRSRRRGRHRHARPAGELNALDLEHVIALRDELRDLADDDVVRVVVLTGAGRGSVPVATSRR